MKEKEKSISRQFGKVRERNERKRFQNMLESMYSLRGM